MYESFKYHQLVMECWDK